MLREVARAEVLRHPERHRGGRWIHAGRDQVRGKLARPAVQTVVGEVGGAGDHESGLSRTPPTDTFRPPG